MDLSERKRSSLDDSRHPWETVRSEFFIDLVRGTVQSPQHIAWLDVGAGDSWLGAAIEDALPSGSSMTCWDANYEASDITTLSATYPKIKFSTDRPHQQFDFISLLDVLEHVEEDRSFLTGLVKHCLSPNGKVMVSVPVHPALFSRHDVALRHFRRYTPDECRRLLRDAGLAIDQEGGLFGVLLPARAASAFTERVLSRMRTPPQPSGVGQWRAPACVTRLFEATLRADVRLSNIARRRGFLLPGLSYWALARQL